MATSNIPATVQALELVGEALKLRAQRFEWTVEVRDRLLQDWRTHFEAHQKWFQKTTSILQKLGDEGQEELADQIARQLLMKTPVVNPANFQIRVYTGFGIEAFQITGSDEMQDIVEANLDVTNVQPSPADMPGSAQPARGPSRQYEEQRLLTFAKPVTGLSDVDMSGWPVWTLHQAVKNRTWISHTGCGPDSAFCIECDCPPMMLPTRPMSPGEGEQYELVPRHFHEDPFEDDSALIHMLKVHGKVFPAGVGEMLQEHGRRVETSVDDDSDLLDQWVIAAHNASVRGRYNELVSRWQRWQMQYPSQSIQGPIRGQRSRVQRIMQLSRTVGADLLPENAYTFLWPPEQADGVLWAVICTNPHCISPHFSYHPFHKDRAIRHFQTHGLHLHEHDILEMFGFKVSDRDAFGGVQNVASDGAPAEDAADEDVSSATSPIESSKPKDRYRLVRGRVEYHKWGVEALLDECAARNIKAPELINHKRVLVKKLLLDDGVVDYENSKEWPFQRLKDECRARGLPAHLNRNVLIKQLQSFDGKVQQEAAQLNLAEQGGPADETGNSETEISCGADLGEYSCIHAIPSTVIPPAVPSPVVSKTAMHTANPYNASTSKMNAEEEDMQPISEAEAASNNSKHLPLREVSVNVVRGKQPGQAKSSHAANLHQETKTNRHS